MKQSILTFLILLNLSVYSNNLAEWEEMINGDKAVGLDVRTFAEVKINPAKGSKHLSYFDLNEKNINKLNIDKRKTVLLFCESGGRAGKSLDILKKAGYSKTVNIKDWRTWNKIISKAKKK